MNNVMVDIETLSTDANGVIVSISAVQFDMKTGELGEEFEVGLKVGQQQSNGGVIDGNTVMWWLKQSPEAIEALTSLQPIGVGNALSQFNGYLESLGHETKDIKLWGNGVTFDNVMIRNLYKRQGKDFALPYWCDCDVRTIVAITGINTSDYKFEGTKHNGIDDCKHQIKYCVDGLQCM